MVEPPSDPSHTEGRFTPPVITKPRTRDTRTNVGSGPPSLPPLPPSPPRTHTHPQHTQLHNPLQRIKIKCGQPNPLNPPPPYSTRYPTTIGTVGIISCSRGGGEESRGVIQPWTAPPAHAHGSDDRSGQRSSPLLELQSLVSWPLITNTTKDIDLA